MLMDDSPALRLFSMAIETLREPQITSGEELLSVGYENMRYTHQGFPILDLKQVQGASVWYTFVGMPCDVACRLIDCLDFMISSRKALLNLIHPFKRIMLKQGSRTSQFVLVRNSVVSPIEFHLVSWR
ncbi:hypothetical protein BG004_001642 [Podila humilis]|nr:hypothetical protein BG004_001642 [Podila humilis]